MRSNVKTLRVDMRSLGRNEILGGWRGMKIEMRNFFQKAKQHSTTVLNKQKESLRKNQESSKSDTLSFNRQTGNWSQTPPRKNNKV